MAAKVQLDIESKANTQALKQATADLERLGMAGKSTNQVFKSTGDLEAYKAAMVKSYESARLFGNQMKATRTAFSDTSKAIKSAQAYLGENKNNMFSYMDEQGVQQQTRNMAVVEKQIRGFLGNVVADTENYQQSMTRNMGEFMDADKFTEGLQKTSDAYKLMGNDLGAVQYKMTAIQQQILDMSGSKNADPEEIKKLANEYKNLTKEHEELAKAQNGTGTRIKNLLKNFISAQLIVWAIRSAFSALTNGLKESSAAAAEAEQTFGRFDAVFEGLERANTAISTMVDNFGVAKSSAADILSSIGNTALGFGASAMEASQFSEKIAASLSDIMAFRDVQGTISDFSQRFMSGASGNVENFRSLGSIVRQSMVDLELQKQGWENLTGQALEWAKVQARVNIVFEQQRKAMGATEREWDTMLSIQRRNNEQTKQMKENIGETVNQFFKPMSEWILTLKENWNAAHEANKQYNEGVYDPTNSGDYADTTTARVLEKRIKSYTGLYGNSIPNMLMHQVKSYAANYTPWGSDKMGALKVEDDPNLKNAKASYEQIQLLAKQYQATLSYTAKLVEKYGFNVSASVWEQIDAYDAYIKKLNDYKKAESDRIATSQAAADALKDFSADIGAMMNLGRSGGMPDVMDYVGKDASGFVSPLDRLLGFEGGEEAELEAKIKSLSSMVEALFNTTISGATEYIRNQATEMLAVVGPALKEAQKAKAAMESATNYNKAKSGIEDELASMQKRNELEALFGKESEEIVSVKLQQWKAEKNAFELFKERLSATGKGKESYQEYRALMELISKQYGIQLDLTEAQIQAAKDLKVEQAKDSATDMFTAASREQSYLGENGDALKAQDEINDSVAEYKKYLTESGESVENVSKKAETFRKILVAINETTEGNKATENAEKLLKSYTDRNDSLKEELSLMQYRASIEGQYAEEEQGIVDLMVQKKQQEAAALAFRQQQVKAGMDAALAFSQYIDELLLANQIYQMNLDLLEKQIQAAKDLKVEQAKDSATEMFKSAEREKSYLGPNGDALKAQDDMNDKVAKYEKYLKLFVADEKTRVDMAKAYRDILEDTARIEGDNTATDNAKSLLKSYTDRNISLSEELAMMKYRATLTGQYSEEESGIVDLLVQKRQQEADALAFMKKQIDAKMDATLAEQQYQAELLLINDIHQMNLDLLLAQIQAAKDLKVEQAKDSAADMFKSAERELSYLGPNGDALKAQDDMNDKVAKYEKYLKLFVADEKTRVDMAKAYRDILEDTARIEGDNTATDNAKSLLKSYTDRNISLSEELAMMKYRATLTGQYSEEESGIVDLLVQKRQQEVEALAFMQKQIDAKMDATLAEQQYQAELLLINDIHQMNLDLLLAQIQAAKDLKVEQAKDSATDMFKSAERELSYLGPNGDALKAQDDMNDKVAEYEKYLKLFVVDEKTRVDMAKAYRDILEDTARIEGENADNKTAKDFTKGFQDRVDALKKTYISLKLTQDLEKQYGSERAAIEQKHIEALQEAWRYMSEQVKLGMDATEANGKYLESAQLITAEYQMQLSLLEEQEKVKRIEALESASKAIAGVVGERALIGASDSQRTQAKIDEQVYAFAEELTQGGAKLKETLDQTAEYRRQLEMQAAEEAYQTVKDSIEAKWESLGDVGMVKGWADIFSTVKEYAMSEAGGSKSEDKASSMAWGNVGMAILMEFLGRLETVNEMLSMVSNFMDMMAPIVDQFLAPLMVIVEPILEMLGNMLIPMLIDLFPVIQAVATALIWVVTVISWVTAAVRYAIGKLTFWTSKDDTSWSDVQAIWDEGVQTTKEIWELEIDARAEYVSALTDAQKGELDAYNEMFKSGLLTLSQYQAMVGKNIYGKNYDNVDVKSFASGGDFITNGEQIIRVGEAGRERVTVTPLNSVGYANRGGMQVNNATYSVVVNGANGDPEEIAMAVRQEFKRMERRGVRYA